jgi:hypothetical protein
MGIEAQFSVIGGLCLCCGDSTRVVAPSRRPFLSTPADIGVCDLCAYALGHAWRRELGQLVRATTPKVVRTYLLVPRLPKNRSETDIASYELLVEAGGGLPSISFAKPGRLCAWLKDTFGCETWEPLLRQCYLGYAASGDFSEVLLARAWGKVPGAQAKARFATFGELLAKPTPDAGFYLGVKTAFESLLWCLESQTQEVSPEEGALCTVMREPAMRYLNAQLVGQHDEEDLTMVEMYRTMMTADELEVARRAVESLRSAGQQVQAAKPASTKDPKEAPLEDEDEPAVDVPGLFDGAETPASAEDIPEGFARPRRTTP